MTKCLLFTEELFVFKYCFIFIVLGWDTSLLCSKGGQNRCSRPSVKGRSHTGCSEQEGNQALAAFRLNINESTKMSPFFALYNRDPVIPLDNILRPRRKYNGDEYHKIALQQQLKSFMLVHKTLKKSKHRQAKYANKNSKNIKFEIGDHVF